MAEGDWCVTDWITHMYIHTIISRRLLGYSCYIIIMWCFVSKAVYFPDVVLILYSQQQMVPDSIEYDCTIELVKNCDLASIVPSLSFSKVGEVHSETR